MIFAFSVYYLHIHLVIYIYIYIHICMEICKAVPASQLLGWSSRQMSSQHKAHGLSMLEADSCRRVRFGLRRPLLLLPLWIWCRRSFPFVNLVGLAQRHTGWRLHHSILLGHVKFGLNKLNASRLIVFQGQVLYACWGRSTCGCSQGLCSYCLVTLQRRHDQSILTVYVNVCLCPFQTVTISPTVRLSIAVLVKYNRKFMVVQHNPPISRPQM